MRYMCLQSAETIETDENFVQFPQKDGINLKNGLVLAAQLLVKQIYLT